MSLMLVVGRTGQPDEFAPLWRVYPHRSCEFTPATIYVFIISYCMFWKTTDDRGSRQCSIVSILATAHHHVQTEKPGTQEV